MLFLKEYLKLEYFDKKGRASDEKLVSHEIPSFWDYDSFPYYQPCLPMQKNLTDCGLFLLEYAESFLRDPEFVLQNLYQKGNCW
jgi:Ulp1 family protease